MLKINIKRERRCNFTELVSQKMAELMTNIFGKRKLLINDRAMFNFCKIIRTAKSWVNLKDPRVLVNVIYKSFSLL